MNYKKFLLSDDDDFLINTQPTPVTQQKDFLAEFSDDLFDDEEEEKHEKKFLSDSDTDWEFSQIKTQQQVINELQPNIAQQNLSSTVNYTQTHQINFLDDVSTDDDDIDLSEYIQKKNTPRKTTTEGKLVQTHFDSNLNLVKYDLTSREGVDKWFKAYMQKARTQEEQQRIKEKYNLYLEQVSEGIENGDVLAQLNLPNAIIQLFEEYSPETTAELVTDIIHLLLQNFNIIDSEDEGYIYEEKSKQIHQINIKAAENKHIDFAENNMYTIQYYDETRTISKRMYKVAYWLDDEGMELVDDDFIKYTKKGGVYLNAEGLPVTITEHLGRTYVRRAEPIDFVNTVDLKYTIANNFEKETPEFASIFQILIKDLQTISETQGEHSPDLAERIYIYLIIGMLNSVVPIYSLRRWQITFIGNYLKRTLDHDLLIGNLLQLPTASGKTFAGLFVLLYSIRDWESPEPRFLASINAKGIWATHDKVLVVQVIQELTTIMSSNIFAYLHFNKDGSESRMPVSSLLNMSMGANDIKLSTGYFTVATYEKARKFLQKNILDNVRGKGHYTPTKTQYFEVIKQVVIDELHSVVEISRGDRIDDIMLVLKNYRIPMLGMSGTLDYSVIDRLHNIFGFELYANVDAAARPYQTIIDHVFETEHMYKTLSQKEKEYFEMQQMSTLEVRMIMSITNYLLRLSTGEEGFKRGIVFINKTDQLEYMYGYFIGLITNLKKYREQLDYIVSHNDEISFLNIKPLDPIKTMLGFFTGYKAGGGDSDQIAPMVSIVILMKYAFSIGIVMEHSRMFNPNDMRTKQVLSNVHSRPFSEKDLEIARTNDLSDFPLLLIFSTTLIATGVNIRDASDLFIDGESVYRMSTELYWQLIGRVGRYTEGHVHFFSYVDDAGNVLRDKTIKHTPFIVPNQYLIERLLNAYTTEKDLQANPALLSKMDSLNIPGPRGGFVGYYETMYSLSMSKRDPNNANRVIINKLGNLQKVFAELFIRDEYRTVNKLSAIYAMNVFFSNHYRQARARYVEELRKDSFKNTIISQTATNNKYYLFDLSLLVPFVVMHPDILSVFGNMKTSLVQKGIRYKERNTTRGNLNRWSAKNILVIEIDRDIARILLNEYMTNFSELPQMDVFFSNITDYMREFLIGVFERPDFLLKTFGVSFFDVFNDMRKYFKMLAVFYTIPSMGTFPKDLKDSIDAYTAYMEGLRQNMIRYAETSLEKKPLYPNLISSNKLYIDLEINFGTFIANTRKATFLLNNNEVLEVKPKEDNAFWNYILKYFNQQRRKSVSAQRKKRKAKSKKINK